MTDELVAFLREALDGQERAALATGEDDASRTWHVGDPWRSLAVVDGHGEIVVYDEGAPSEAAARHIAMHDPAWVLRDVAAKRRIIDEHYPVDPCDAHDASLRTVPCNTLLLLLLAASIRQPSRLPGGVETDVIDERWEVERG